MVREVDLDYLISAEQHNHCNCTECVCDKDIDYKQELLDKYNRVLKHLDLVSMYCRKLAKALIMEGEYDLAHQLIIAGQYHDGSKLTNPNEWNYLCEYVGGPQSPQVQQAVYDHVRNNSHHPEFFDHKGGIHAMSDLNLAETWADWQARGDEFNNPIGAFLLEKGFEKYKFDVNSAPFKKLDYYHKLVMGHGIMEDECI